MDTTTTTQTKTNKEPLMVTVPWATLDKDTGAIELTGNVSDRCVIAALLQRTCGEVPKWLGAVPKLEQKVTTEEKVEAQVPAEKL